MTSPKMSRLIMTTGALIILFNVSSVAFLTWYCIHNHVGIKGILVSIGFSYILYKFWQVFSFLISKIFIYGPISEEYNVDVAEFKSEYNLPIKEGEQKPVTQEIARELGRVIDRPDSPRGHYKDAEYYDWIDLQFGELPVKRFSFHSVINLDCSKIEIPSNCIMLSPGIIYEEIEQ